MNEVGSKFKVLAPQSNLQNENGISMKEAYRIAIEEVVKDNPHALLYSISSTNSIKNPEDITAGKFGLRKYWNLIFTEPNTTDYWLVFIRNKRIKEIVKVIGSSMNETDLIENMDSLINSNEALRIAKEDYKLKPGEGWAIGYHFTLNRISGDIIIQVFGRDSHDNFTKISINAKTKEVMDAIHKVTHDGVTYNWEVFNKP